MDIENELIKIDFSKYSKIKESLLEKLLQVNRREESREDFFDCELSEEVLDQVAAAGIQNFDTETKNFFDD